MARSEALYVMLRKVAENWEAEIVRPIIVSLATAICLFLGSLAFAPVREFLFPPEGDPTYPVYCIVEPYRSAIDPKKLNVDVFIINRTEKAWTREELATILRTGQVQQSVSLGPDVNLRYTRKVGQRNIGVVEGVVIEEDFNRGKGEAKVQIKGNDVRITIQYLSERAIMKVTIVVAGIPEIERGGPISRVDKGSVPFDYETYQIACHDR